MSDEIRNRLLRLLPGDELDHVLSPSEEAPLTKRQAIHRYGVRMQHVYFVESGLVSVGAKVAPQKFVEVWLTGSEGYVGAALALTRNAQPLHRRRHIGWGWISFGLLLLTCRSFVSWCTTMSGPCSFRRFSQAHAIALPLTRQVLSQLLGVRRAGVTDCPERLIEMKRAHILIRDAPGLAQISCPCWRLIKREYERQLGAGAFA